VNRFLWTDDRVAVLRELYPNTRTTAIAQRLGASVASVHTKASKLGLKKTREYMSAEHGAHARLVGVATRIKPGAVSWNKGLHYMPAGNGATRFKPGQRPHNTAQVGALRVNADGYLDVKVGDFPDAPWKNWERVHRLVWIEAHGPIPSGFVVAFKPGRKTVVRDEITLDALELVPKVEIMKRNTVHRHGPEIARLSQIKGAIVRQINRRERERA